MTQLPNEDALNSVEAKAREKGIDDRIRMGKRMGYAFIVLFAVTLVLLFFFGFVICTALTAKNPAATMALASLTQVIFGMTTGYICIFMGLLMTWYWRYPAEMNQRV